MWYIIIWVLGMFNHICNFMFGTCIMWLHDLSTRTFCCVAGNSILLRSHEIVLRVANVFRIWEIHFPVIINPQNEINQCETGLSCVFLYDHLSYFRVSNNVHKIALLALLCIIYVYDDGNQLFQFFIVFPLFFFCVFVVLRIISKCKNVK